MDLVTSRMELSSTEMGKTAEESVGKEVRYSIWNILSLKYLNSCQIGNWLLVGSFEFRLLT